MRAIGRERRVGPAVGRVGAADLDGGLDPGRRVVGVHRHPGLAGPDERPDRGPLPDLLLLALLAALIGGMVSLPGGLHGGHRRRASSYDLLQWNITNPSTGSATVELILFVLLPAALLVAGRVVAEGDPHRRALVVGHGHHRLRAHRQRPAHDGWARTGVLVAVVVAALLAVVLDVGRSFLMSQICIYGVIALSLTVLTGWAGQVSLGQFGFVAVGADMAAHLGGQRPAHPPAALRRRRHRASCRCSSGSPPLRIRGLYLAVSTLGFALFMQTSVLATPCLTLPLIHKTICSGLPNPQSTLIARPTLFGLGPVVGAAPSPGSRSPCWSSRSSWSGSGVTGAWPGGSSPVRDNEVAAGSAGIPVVRTKLLAFALSGFIAGYAGVCLAFATERFTTDTFDPTFSILVVSMVVIGGLDSIPGAILGALYLEGLPAIFGSTPTIEFLTSGIGLMAFILYLPGGMAQVMHQLGDLATAGVENLQARRRGAPPGAPAPGATSTRPPSRSTTRRWASAEPGRGPWPSHRRRLRADAGAVDRRRPGRRPRAGRPDGPGPPRDRGAGRGLRRVAGRDRRQPGRRGRGRSSG